MASRGYPPKQPIPGDWQHGIFGCFDNMGICIMTFFCPCVTFGKNAEAMGESCLICGFIHCYVPIAALMANTAFRQKIGEQNGIEGNLTMDIICMLFCGYCTLCQEAQEIEYMQAMQAGGPVGYGGGPVGYRGGPVGYGGGQSGYPPPNQHMEIRRH